MKMTILSPGPLTTVQDMGRFGHMRAGFPASGAMDTYSMELANLLAGNAPGVGVLEMTLTGICARFDCGCVIALTGADMMPRINEMDIPMYQAVSVQKGDTLTMGAAKTGMRCYLAVSGGFDLPMVMGSQSTNLKCGLGGFHGRKLQMGDELPLNQSVPLSLLGQRKVPAQNSYPGEITLRVVLGPQDGLFSEAGLGTFLSQVYTVSPKSDRMGLRLEGETIESKNGVDIISDGIAFGSIQVPASGMPMILMADRQTTGGYAKIATVISVDLKKAAQARPGTQIRFASVTRSQAVELLRQEKRKLSDYEYAMMYCL